MVKKTFKRAGIAFLVFFIAFRPTPAASVFKSLGSGLVDVATGVGDFFTQVVAR